MHNVFFNSATTSLIVVSSGIFRSDLIRSQILNLEKEIFCSSSGICSEERPLFSKGGIVQMSPENNVGAQPCKIEPLVPIKITGVCHSGNRKKK